MKTDPRSPAARQRPKAPSKAKDRRVPDKTSPKLRDAAGRNINRKVKNMKKTKKSKKTKSRRFDAAVVRQMIAGPVRRVLLALLAIAAAALLLVWGCRGASGAMSDCIDATCRITAADQGRGTGCVFEIDQGHVYVLTAAHVVGNGSSVRCEFWRGGHQSQPIPGRVLSRVSQNDVDAAIIAIGQDAFGGLLPSVVPVAAPDFVLRPGDTLTSVGCANGAWSTGWKGHVLDYSGADLRFTPPPAQGRSGSAVFDADGSRIVGLIRARTIDNQQGIACSVQSLYRTLGYPAADRAQCGPNGCGNGPDYRLLPFRQKVENQLWQGQNQQQGQNGPWPTLPPPGAASLDLSETNRKLDRIAELLQQTRPGAGAIPPAADPRVESAEKSAKETGAAVTEIKQEQSKLREGLGQVHSVLQSLTGDPLSLPERIHARVEKVKGEGAEGTREVVRAYVKDLVGEKLTDGSAGMTVGKIVGGALGVSGPVAVALAGGLWLVSRRLGRRIRSGEPLLLHQALAHLSDKLEAIKSRVSDKGA